MDILRQCLLAAGLFLLGGQAFAQSTPTKHVTNDAKTGIRVTTIATPLPSPVEELKTLEAAREAANQDPARVADGTVAKYDAVIAQKRAEIAAAQQPQPVAPRQAPKPKRGK